MRATMSDVIDARTDDSVARFEIIALTHVTPPIGRRILRCAADSQLPNGRDGPEAPKAGGLLPAKTHHLAAADGLFHFDSDETQFCRSDILDRMRRKRRDP